MSETGNMELVISRLQARADGADQSYGSSDKEIDREAIAAMRASLSREAALREALEECRDQLWLLAKNPKDNPWIKQADAALAR